MALKVGDRLGPYDIMSRIGIGGMGVVYRAVDTRLDRTVAIKVLPPGLTRDDGARQRFVREAKAASGLDHANICTIFEVDETPGGELYLAMAYYEGETLKNRIDRGRLPVMEALDIARQVADGLASAHQSGIIHRDIKPANVILTPRGEVKVLDFGIAKLVGQADLTQTGTLLGTVAYMSPEQVRGEKADRRSDIWALGVVLYEMLTGELPFHGEHLAAQVHAITNHAARRPSEVCSDLPNTLDVVVSKALEKSREARYQTATAIRSDLAGHRAPSASETLVGGSSASAGGAPKPRVVVPVGATLVSIVMATLLWGSWRTVAPADDAPPALTITPLTNRAGLSLSGSWSPDGSQLAFDHTWDGTMDVSVMSLEGGESRLVAGGPSDEMLPRWSPDGSKIAFVSDDGTGLTAYWAAPTGGLRRQLAETHFPYLDRFSSIGAIGTQPWSPDGRHFVFSRLEASGAVGLWTVNAESGEEVRLTEPADASDFQASWSHDGERIAFRRSTLLGSSDLYVVPASGGEPEILLGDEKISRSPTWSLDDTKILFVAYTGAFGGDLWDVEVDDGSMRQLTIGAEASTPIISSTGRIAYSRWDHETFFFKLAPGSSDDHEQISLSGGSNFGQRFSPDGRQIVFQSSRSGGSQVWLHDVATGAEQQLTRPPEGKEDRTPDWSPDGEEIVFLSNRGGPFQLWVTSVEGRATRRLSEQVIPMDGDWWVNARVAPRWATDGRAIAYLAPGARDSTLWLIGPDGSNARETEVSGVLRFDWYDDGRQIIYTRHANDSAGQMEMVAADLESGDETLLLATNATELSVAPDGRAVAYSSADGHFSMNGHVLPLERPETAAGLPRAAGEPEQVTFGEGIWHTHGNAWTPDGASIVYTRDFDSGNLNVIDNYR